MPIPEPVELYEETRSSLLRRVGNLSDSESFSTFIQIALVVLGGRERSSLLVAGFLTR